MLEDKRRQNTLKNMIKDFKVTKKIKRENYLKFLFDRILCNNKYKKLIDKSQIQIDKELDLHKFIHRIRLLITAVMGLLTTQ